MYRRNWDFLEANRDLEIDSKPLSSYFQFQPVESYDINAVNDSTDDEWYYHKVAEAHQAMEARTKFRRLMTTANKPLLGLVSSATQQGDFVIVLTHHSRPLIASIEVPEGGSIDDLESCTFTLKGEAFIPGIMEGELFEDLQSLPMIKFTFD